MTLSFKITNIVEVSAEKIKNALCCAFEGGSNYWYMNLSPAEDNVIPYKEFRETGSQQEPGDYWHWCQIMPLVEGCAVTFEDKHHEGGTKLHRLDVAAIENGLAVMADKEPKHFADLISENDDCITGDVFLQCCVFGEVLYG